MKPTGNTTSPSRYSIRGNVNRKVKNAVLCIGSEASPVEIHAIQAEMHGELNEPATEKRLAKFFEDSSAVPVLNRFQSRAGPASAHLVVLH